MLQIVMGFGVAIAMMILRSALAVHNANTFLETTRQVAHTHDVLEDHRGAPSGI